VGIRTALSKLSKRRREPTLERAEEAYSEGRKSDAAAMFRALAESGSAPAQLRLAQMYERGEGVLQNFVEAVRWFRSAAEQDSGPAVLRLGEIYLTGLSAPQTATPAALARLENVLAAFDRLGALHAEGVGLPQDFEAAAQWFYKGADRGDATALYHLGTLQLGGLGMPSDPQAAFKRYREAATRGSGAASLQLGIL